MCEIYFKATKEQSNSYWKWKYRKIIKEWDLNIDIMKNSDDVIRINLIDFNSLKPKFNSISIDLDNKKWIFRLFTD